MAEVQPQIRGAEMAIPLALCALLGASLDFLVYGVAEVIWAVVYVPLFLAAASILYTQLIRSRWEKWARASMLALIAGIVLARLGLTNHHRQATYAMVPTISGSITLRSEQWPRTLLVSSEKLRVRLAGKPPGGTVPVLVDVIADYGCITSFTVSTVDGIDVQQDKNASWTWRAEESAPRTGAGQEDQAFPWCRFRLYRKT